MKSSASLTFYRILLSRRPFLATTATVKTGMAESPAAQKKDSLNAAYSHTPKKASILSAVLPGAGQFYNQKYWKIPIVYAAAGTSIFFISYNQKIYEDYRKAYRYRIDGDTNTKDLEY